MGAWFLHGAGRQSGPWSASDVLTWADAGQLPPDAAVWREGMPSWVGVGPARSLLEADRTAPPGSGPQPGAQAQPGSPDARQWARDAAGALADLAGVERLEGFSLRSLLSESLRRHGSAEIERRFSTGLPETTPDISRIEPGWPRPWMFMRALVATGLLFAGFLLAVQTFDNAKLLPGMIMVGSFVAPLASVVFFFELNTARNVSLYQVLRMLIGGGLLSLVLALLLYSLTGPLDRLGPPLAGLVEEVAKLVTVAVLAARLDPRRYPWILNGMLFGAAVGAGFAAFESAGYAFESMFTDLGGMDLPSTSQSILMRGLLTPFGHVVWTTLAAGAVWRVKLDRPLSAGMLVHPRVLRVLAVTMSLHAIWNFTLFAPPFMAKQVVLGVLAWVLAFGLLQSGIKQIQAAQRGHPPTARPPTAQPPTGHTPTGGPATSA